MNRKETFRTRFDTAAFRFGVKSEQIVSLQLRETVSSSHDYRHLLSAVRKDAEFNPSVIEGNLQGRGCLLWQGKTKIIIVEHTTGLKILYITFFIVSLAAVGGEELKLGNYRTMH